MDIFLSFAVLGAMSGSCHVLTASSEAEPLEKDSNLGGACFCEENPPLRSQGQHGAR